MKSIFPNVKAFFADRRASKSAQSHSDLLSAAHTARRDALETLSERQKRGDTRGQHQAYQKAKDATNSALRAELGLGDG